MRDQLTPGKNHHVESLQTDRADKAVVGSKSHAQGLVEHFLRGIHHRPSDGTQTLLCSYNVNIMVRLCVIKHVKDVVVRGTSWLLSCHIPRNGKYADFSRLKQVMRFSLPFPCSYKNELLTRITYVLQLLSADRDNVFDSNSSRLPRIAPFKTLLVSMRSAYRSSAIFCVFLGSVTLSFLVSILTSTKAKQRETTVNQKVCPVALIMDAFRDYFSMITFMICPLTLVKKMTMNPFRLRKLNSTVFDKQVAVCLTNFSIQPF